MKTSLKEVKIIARYIHKTNGKANGRISYLVRSSNGKDVYCTTIINGKASGCSCPSKKPCYHMTQLEAIEAARTPLKAVKSEPVESSSTQPIKELMNSRMSTIELAAKARMMNAPLNGNRGFSILR